MTKRDKKPERVHEVLDRVLERGGFAGRLKQSRVVEEWAQLVGDHIAEVTRAEVVGPNGVLIVSVKTNAWMTELALLEPEILATVNRAIPTHPIEKIRWQLMR
ncbi:MAG: DciA family protein [Gemmatimonadaceae bacterium]